MWKDRLRSKQEAADFLGISTRTVWRLIRAGKLASLVVGGQRKIKESDLRKFVDAGSKAPLDALTKAGRLNAAVPQLDEKWERAVRKPRQPDDLDALVAEGMALRDADGRSMTSTQLWDWLVERVQRWHSRDLIFEDNQIKLAALGGNPPRYMSKSSIASVVSRARAVKRSRVCDQRDLQNHRL